MDSGVQVVSTLWGGGTPPLREDTEAGVMRAIEGRCPISAWGIAAGRCSPEAGLNVLRTGRKLKKDVSLEGTNLTSPLESTRLSKNELEMN
jgi:hypothetical protein